MIDIFKEGEKMTGRPRYSFEDDLVRGKIAEDRVVRFIESLKQGPVFRAPQSYFPDWDMVWRRNLGETKREATIEVKMDSMYQDTGNVAVEYGCNGLRSGILKSEAEYWVYVCGNDGYFMERNKLIVELVRTLQGKRDFRLVKGGLNDSMELMLVPFSHIEAISYKHALPI